MHTFYWIVKLDNDTTISQYDFQTGEKVKWSEVPEDKVKILSYFPFRSELAELVGEDIDIVVSIDTLPVYTCEIPEEGKPLPPKRTHSIKSEKFHYCKNCDSIIKKYKFEVVHEEENSQTVFYQCPKCDAQDGFACTNCGEIIHHYPDLDEPCPNEECSSGLWSINRVLVPGQRQKSELEYHLGYVLNGKEYKITIDHYGNVDLN